VLFSTPFEIDPLDAADMIIAGRDIVQTPYPYPAHCYPDPPSRGREGTFSTGIAANVGGDRPAKFVTSDGRHLATANRLPERYVTSVRMDPSGPTGKTIYVTLGGYSSHWIPVGAFAENVSRSAPATSSSARRLRPHAAGETCADVSGDLVDAPATASRGEREAGRRLRLVPPRVGVLTRRGVLRGDAAAAPPPCT